MIKARKRKIIKTRIFKLEADQQITTKKNLKTKKLYPENG